MILFDENGFLSPDNIIEETIGVYVTAACMGNHLITSKTKFLNNNFDLKINQEISIKKLLEWRMQEIINSLFNQLLPEQNLYQEIFRETEKTLITTALKGTNNNQSKAAKFLGINRNTLRKKIKELKIN
jgi:DNA-binding protein Fis